MKKYNLQIPGEVHQEIERIAKEYDNSPIEVYQAILKLGLTVYAIEQTVNEALFLKKGDGELVEITLGEPNLSNLEGKMELTED